MARRNRKKGKSNGRKFSKTYQPENRGRPRIDPAVKELKNLTTTALSNIVCNFLFESEDNLKRYQEIGSMSGLEKAVISILLRSIKDGDHIKLEFLLQRTIGKVKEQIDLKTIENKVNKMGMGELTEAAEKALEFIRNQGG
jgi:hypothetical protein